jgi:hypothetical protein
MTDGLNLDNPWPTWVNGILGYEVGQVAGWLGYTSEAIRKWATDVGVLRLRDRPTLVLEAVSLLLNLVQSRRATIDELRPLLGYLGDQAKPVRAELRAASSRW